MPPLRTPSGSLRRIGRDLRELRHLEIYTTVAVVVVVGVLSLVPDLVPEGVRSAALLAGVALLLYRLALPEGEAGIDHTLGDRERFESRPLAPRLRRARRLWMFAPSGVNFLRVHERVIRRHLLAHQDAEVRIVVLDPDRPDAIQLAQRQLDESLDHPVQEFERSLETTVELLERMAGWNAAGTVAGRVAYRFLPYNPGFSLVLVDPGRRDGVLIAETHGFHNDSTDVRMHLMLTPSVSRRWYDYWVGQFEAIWRAARSPG